MGNRDWERSDDEQEDPRRYRGGYDEHGRWRAGDERGQGSRYAREPSYDPERDRYAGRYEDYQRGRMWNEPLERGGAPRFDPERGRDSDRSQHGEYRTSAFYGSRDFGWYGGGHRRERGMGPTREFEREDYERPRASFEPAGSPGQPQRSFQGRGPRGYKRSDERIREDVCDCLMQDHEVDASGIDVRVSDGQVMLDGTIDTRYAKHRAENLCERISGVQDVANHLRVRRDVLLGSEHASPSSTSTPSAADRLRNAGNNPARS